jgi:N-formylmaleamate deformylase
MAIEARGERGFVEANGLRLSYLAYGEERPDRPAIVIAPGITSPAITWEFVAERLAADTRVYALDIRGRGASDGPPSGYSLPDYAADVAGTIAALGLERPVLLGHSMGARIGAALGVLHPGITSGLVLADPPLTGPGRERYNISLESFRQQLHEAYAGTTAAELRRYYPRWSERELQLRAEVLPSCLEHAIVQTHEHFDVEDFFAYWRELSPPLLLIYGEESPAVSAAGVAELQAANPAAQVVGIPDAGHMIPWENLQDFVTAVREFRPLAAD